MKKKVININIFKRINSIKCWSSNFSKISKQKCNLNMGIYSSIPMSNTLYISQCMFLRETQQYNILL